MKRCTFREACSNILSLVCSNYYFVLDAQDLKPSNIGVSEDCEIKILDFGLGRPSLIYSLDTRVRYSTYLLTFKSQKGSSEALDVFIITS